MPHIIVEHDSPNNVDTSDLVKALHKEALSIDAFPPGGIRVREHVCLSSRVADGAEENGFIYIYVRIGQGRDEQTQREIGDRLFGVLTKVTTSKFEQAEPISLGLEVQEINSDLTWKKNNIHELLKK